MHDQNAGNPMDRLTLARSVRMRSRVQSDLSDTVGQPFSITNIELTNHCPMRCTICPRTNEMTRPLGFMSDEVFERIVRELAAVNPDNAPGGVVYLHHFGESLLHRRLDVFGQLAYELGIVTSLSLNPMVLSGSTPDRLLDARIGVLQFAIDGYDDASFETVRGIPEAYGVSVERMEAYLERHRKAGSPSRIVINLIDVPGLPKERMEAEAERWRAVPGVDAVYRKPYVTWNGTSTLTNRRMKSCAAECHSDGSVVCREPFESLSIAWDGSVLACCFDYDAFYVLGNIREQSLSELWNGERIRALRAEFISGDVTNPLCRNCRYLRTPILDSSVLFA